MHVKPSNDSNELVERARAGDQQAFDASERYGSSGNYVMGANIAGFLKVANAMLDQGLV